EILYGIQEKLPDLPQINQDDLAELRTLQEIQDYLVGLGGSSVTSAAPVAAAAAPVSSGLSSSAIQEGLFSVVAEKTGYVSDMLELSMDMEADLGIDSIKRVEILYGIQEKLPDLPQINQDDLAELRTLQEIQDYLVGLGGGASQDTVIAAAPQATAATSGLSTSAIQAGLFSVVAEKTGYVSDMLELSMDMEADLGIDSIKRVEILYGIQEKLPDLPQINQDDLAELRTLQEILDYLVGLGGGGSDDTPTASAVPATQSATGISSDAIKAGLFTVVAEKTGYVADMLELGMDMEADLGIDSIKRVEILYGIQEQLPDLPQINQDDLAELRTLQEILDYLVALGGSSTNETAHAAPAATGSGLSSDAIQAGLFSVVAEKTGYVADMLELSMDMEADLGIDSIKRVEILYGIQEKLPDLPQINQDDLAELRTLNEILDYLVGLGGSSATSAAAAPTEVAEAPQKKKSNLAGWRKSVFLKELSAPDQLLSPQPKKQGVVITYDGTPATAELAKELKKQGWGQISVLLLPKEFVSGFKHLPGDLEAIQLTDTSETSINEALAEFRKLSPIASFIHIEPPSEVTDSLFLDKQRESLKLVFFLAKHLSADLKSASEKVRASFVVATRMDGKLGAGRDQNFGIIQGGFAGLVKSLKAEWEDIFCRMIDLSPAIKGKKAGQLIARELSDPNSGLLEVGLTGTQRFTLLAHGSDTSEDLEASEITKEDLIIVSGGAKGVTAASVLALAKAYQPRLLLVGRSKLPKTDPDWTKGETTQEGLQRVAVEELKSQGEKPTPVKTKALMAPILASNEIRATLAALEAAGSEAHYLSLDITNKEDVVTKLTKAQDKLGKATGLIHGAGVLADKFIEKKEPADFDWVYGTKVGGLENLFAAFERDQLKTLVLFSSSAGFYGNSGQSDYSLSNEILNKLAYQYSYANPEASVSSINWGPWDGGMVTDSLKKHFESRGVAVIPQPVGTKIMVDECSKALKSKVQIVVGSNMVLPPKLSPNLESHIIRRHLNLEENAFFNDHALQGDSVLPMVHALSWMVEGARGLYSGYHLHEVTDVSVLNGVILSKELPPGFDLFISELEKTSDTVLLEAKIQSQNGDKTRYHYSVKILLGMKAPESQMIKPNLEASQSEEGASLYKNRVLFHGPAFQMVTEVLNQNEGSLTLKCNTPRPTSLGQFAFGLFNPFSEDVLLQAMLIQAHKLTGNASLPLKISKAKMFHPSPLGRDFYVTLEVVKSSAGNLEAKVYSHSKSGKVYASFENAQVTISEKLNAKFLS
ncbi:MAG: SDR family NAD(P)-dependent oxidoreductase, partial [SAR324 cluster bacterium]|nr:SDR family NAD(P)-dependent oxidoreductase [SAR324 cluster bacterium]